MSENNNEQKIDLALRAADSYLKYSMSVVKGRSIPYVQDGLKPVHRRILYTMKELKLWSTSHPTKSARVVGDVLGKYHPHGDSSVYEAMVRMSQNFSLRYPLISGEGNWGTRDGDSAAAMRYTEAKLSPIADALLNELTWDTVDFQPNYDGKEQEPVLLPARLPFLLLNGSEGIGVGMATDIPSHNIREVVDAAIFILKNPKANLADILNIIQGPDLPTGGQIINSKKHIEAVYETGNGSLKLRSKWKVETLPNNKGWNLVFYEIPYGVGPDKIMIEINDLLNPKPKEVKDKDGKNKKGSISAEQLRLKKIFSDMIDTVDDFSVTDLAITISPKSKKQDPEQLALALCAHTSLEGNISVNMVVVDDKGNPRLSNVMEWLSQWCSFRVNTMRRLFQDQLDKAQRRIHILEGRSKILNHIMEVVKLITESANPRQDLMEKYDLTEIQVEDILEMRLRALSRLEKEAIENELKELRKKEAKLIKILSSENNLKKEVIKELESDLTLYGDDRRTTIMEAEPATIKDMISELVQDKASNESIAVAFTERGWLSWKVAKSIDEVTETDFKLKTGDSIRRTFFGTRADVLMLLDQQGKGYSINLTDLSGRNDSNAFNAFIDPSTKIVEGALGKQEDYFLLSGENGYGFIVQGNNWICKQKSGKNLISLSDMEAPLEPILLRDFNPENEENTTKLATLTTDGKMVVLPLKDVKVLPKGKGVALMNVAKDQKLLDLTLVKKDGTVILKSDKKEQTINSKDLDKVFKARSASHKGKALNTKQSWTGFNKFEIIETQQDNGENNGT